MTNFSWMKSEQMWCIQLPDNFCKRKSISFISSSMYPWAGMQMSCTADPGILRNDKPQKGPGVILHNKPVSSREPIYLRAIVWEGNTLLFCLTYLSFWNFSSQELYLYHNKYVNRYLQMGNSHNQNQVVGLWAVRKQMIFIEPWTHTWQHSCIWLEWWSVLVSSCCY